MAQYKVYDMTGKEVSTVELSDSVFGIEPNVAVMHEAVVAFLANQRQGTQSTKTRAEVSGGGRKPWRQKGTGRARQGSIRSPQWTHGGVALGPKPRDYRVSMNRKAHKLAMISALSSKVKADELILVDNIALEGYKTKAVAEMLSKLGAEGKTAIVLNEKDPVVIKSAANIEGVSTMLSNTINVYDILNCGKMVLTVDAAKKIEEVYAK
ncbi:MAG: 50S ribosomal protein L4 [Oscillospiraceae bacterium]|nr:50S ribosomal protein L4 [Oscillospiraceae bacterium]